MTVALEELAVIVAGAAAFATVSNRTNTAMAERPIADFVGHANPARSVFEPLEITLGQDGKRL
ncbi:hypothetical protein OF122_14105 [Pelagibacterium flavum]|uniref:Uncharacterized protein n=1 Tax=Pelagibacterium flavum TaxID=2984530 RepID=A0ABY6ILG0_9HYPH|nr:hypothetical protein [Pelagibacterium sp. YIM 151497]UYQ71174.1 hypothetical protein OF122_14105 [Pelagibacterium sp. YIM 151497]